MIRSGGALVKSPTYEYFTPASWNGIPQPGITQALRWGSYDGIYRGHLWVSVLVNKIANAAARLPLKVYERGTQGRMEARDHPYSELIRRPSDKYDSYSFWLWVVSTLNVYGEAFLIKERDPGGRPVKLHPMHPSRMQNEDDAWFFNVADRRVDIKRSDFVHFKFYDPGSMSRGMSPLEPLRATLENDYGARQANSAIFRNGARPSVVLSHPGSLSEGAARRIASSWDDMHQGANNFAKTAVLEEGIEAQVLTLNAEELQYIETRKLNREEACAIYDVPPPVVHILDRATFSNITEQMRSMYRDTMAPKLGLLESTLDMELRDGRFGRAGDPDFGDDVYAEFLMDEVLRGSFEARVPAIVAAINAGLMTPAEGREIENRPFIEGTDQLFINAAVVPLDSADALEDPTLRRHLLGAAARMKALNGGTPDD